MVATDSGRSTKSRGCFQCSKRRIICDLGEPVCLKCQKKGIDCSGLGRFRFTACVATRGKLKGCTIPVVDANPDTAYKLLSDVPSSIRWRHDRNKVAKKQKPGDGGRVGIGTGKVGRLEPNAPALSDARVLANSGQRTLDMDTHGAVDGFIVETDLENAKALSTTVTNGDTGLILAQQGYRHTTQDHGQQFLHGKFSLRRWIAPIDHKTRQSFDYFAKYVAPVMVVLDISNGYRDLILPMAFEDELLQQAVSVVAAQHLRPRQPSSQATTESNRSAIISRLRSASQLGSPDLVFNQSTWATLIVLLVGETVTGSSEYSHLLQTLLTLASNMRAVENSELNEFLTKQTDMFAFLGQPLLNEDLGAEQLRNPIDPGVWMASGVHTDFHHDRTLSLVKQGFAMGAQIYLQRATTNQSSWDALEGLRQLLCQVNPTEPGAHGFVWSCFIAAADSVDPAHRSFFTNYLKGIHSRTLFDNIPKALAVLPAIWEQQCSRKWTEDLPSLSPILIM
ncbi:hypothetical protein BO94DRAFT_550809 [Aspergillus sclerotioniger CBS 115572]|uniref:Zn(2)-C6 fungal-type domain-containing protein n=1 Tax=Aspergillus sclerotioniger CBS 115572 TaxID=1450535 RepID=A0A317V5S8_9EURO|nr:hypothetical protein BO94DRAFT_550809 [Aspergillus sclerotioniger CBS 115572]PWY69643.1 hypothetical protein BO94DRAFT_550809 [Aspergillus sclerotioniger CBS 115572]